MALNPPGARVCVMFPIAARDPVTCAGLSLPPVEPPPDPEQRIVASGIVRFDEPDAGGYAAVFSVTHGPMAHAMEPDLEVAQQFAKGMSDGAAESAKAQVRKGWPQTELRRWNGGPAAARISFYLDGLTGDRKRMMEHVAAYAVWVKGGVYAFMLMSGGEHAIAIDALTDDSARSIRYSHPAPPRPSREYRVAYLFGQVFVWAILAIGGLGLTIVLVRRGRKPVGVGAMNRPGPPL